MTGPRDAQAMPERPRRGPVDYVVLADALSALGYPARLELLDQLKFPHAAGEVRVAPTRSDEAGSPERAVAPQTVRYHLEKLVEAGFVRQEPAGKDKGPARYIANAQKLWAVTEELRALSRMYAGRGPLGDETGTVVGGAPATALAGPRLVLVHGVYEGKPFPLPAPARGEASWTIGRQRGLALSLDYDPFVSLENTVVAARDGAYTVTDLATSKNGTTLNWAPIPRGVPTPLRAGDVIGVGRSLLLFLRD
jgi:DNA-binding transcriptional ArsR family regulator